MTLYVVRHGETDWNKERRLQGQADIELNEFGRQLARETAKGMSHISFTEIYSSPLLRAKETAEIIANGRVVKTDDRLKEMSFGPYEGLCCSKDNWEIPDPKFEYFFSAPDKYCPPEGGDTFEEVKNRVESFLSDIEKKHRGSDNVLVVCHGVVVGAFLAIVKKRTIAEFWGDTVQKNCATNIIEISENGYALLETGKIYYNETVKDW